MATKVLSDADLTALMNDVDTIAKNPEKLKALAEEFQRKMEEQKEKRKKYQKEKTPEQKRKQAEYMKRRSAQERARMKLILQKAKELNLLPELTNEQ